jgi:hypothetical protein
LIERTYLPDGRLGYEVSDGIRILCRTVGETVSFAMSRGATEGEALELIERASERHEERGWTFQTDLAGRGFLYFDRR